MLHDISCQKVTHIGRVYGATQGMELGSSVVGMMNQGLWQQGNALRACYDRTYPTDALMALSGFNGDRRDDYFIARDHLGK